MKKKGFTLIELLAVIVILAILALIVSPIISKVIKEAKISSATRSMEGFVKSINSASMLYTVNNYGEIATSYRNIESLVEAKNKNQIKEPIVAFSDSGLVAHAIAQIDNYYCVYKEAEGANCRTTLAGLPVYFDPVKGKICNDYQKENSETGTKSGCMLFYVLNYDGKNIDLILDHNTSSQIKWSEDGSIANGPVTALAQLKEDTKGWNGVNTRIDSYTLTQDVNGVNTSYTINYVDSKARFITAQEIADITGATDKNKFDESKSNVPYFFDSLTTTQSVGTNKLKKVSDYAWLFNNLGSGTSFKCKTFGCTTETVQFNEVFYWTATTVAGNSTSIWAVYTMGEIVYTAANSGPAGIRPVITISNEKLKETPISSEDPTKVKAGTKVYFDPVKGKICNDYTEDNSKSNKKTGCMLFYVVNDDGENIDLILDHNTSGGIKWSGDGNTSNGPVTALAQLKEDTKGWIGVTTRTDSYTLSQNVNGVSTNYTVNYNGSKARFITAQEIADVRNAKEKIGWDETTAVNGSWYFFDSLFSAQVSGSNMEIKVSNHAWLFNNLQGCQAYGCTMDKTQNNGQNVFYWTATSVAGTGSTGSVWYVGYPGFIMGNSPAATSVGIRPVITIKKTKLKEEPISSADPNKVKSGTIVYFEPVKGKICNDYKEENSESGTKLGCMLFYVVNDNGNTLDLILDHNTSSGIKWAKSGSNSSGPVTALAQLKEDTSGWHSSLSRTDSYTLTQNVNGVSTNYTVNYNGSKARLITAQEIADITGATEINNWNETTSNGSTCYYLDSLNRTQTVGAGKTKTTSDYAWLFNNLNGGSNGSCIKYGCTIDKGNPPGDYGYWTATAIAGDSDKAWSVYFDGDVPRYGTVGSHVDRGIRPVITISKSILD